MTATVHVVELGLRRVIVHVDDEEKQLTLGKQLFQLGGACCRRRYWSVSVAADAVFFFECFMLLNVFRSFRTSNSQKPLKQLKKKRICQLHPKHLQPTTLLII